MPEWLIGFLTGVELALIGWVLAWLQRKVTRQDEQREAVAALRFELASNLGWLDDIFKSHNYLRDEAWVILKNKGHISYLPNPIPMTVIKVYERLHRLNERIRVLKETKQSSNATADPCPEAQGEIVHHSVCKSAAAVIAGSGCGK